MWRSMYIPSLIIMPLPPPPRLTDTANSLLPDAAVIGNDLSPIQPVYVPPNLHFEIDDCEQEWPFPHNHFDLVHIRNLSGAVRDWKKLYAQAFRCVCVGPTRNKMRNNMERRDEDIL